MAFVSRNAVLSVHEQRQTVLMHQIEECFVILRHRSALSAEQRISLAAGTRVCVYRLEKHVSDALALLKYDDDKWMVARLLDMQAYVTAAHLRLDLIH